ncbi:MAG: hypothetical protein E3J72_21145 [Planctomycetota bacterium]|nr:MAG: hypothetical protein E3J72_21145 [Planctomycetota bacterium]
MPEDGGRKTEGDSKEYERYGFNYNVSESGDAPVKARKRIEVPEGAVSSKRAKVLDDLFLDRVTDNISHLGSVVSPLTDEEIEFSFDESDLVRRNETIALRSLMERHEDFDSGRLDELPHNGGFDYNIYTSGLLKKKARLAVVISAQVLSPLETHVVNGFSDEPLPPTKLHDLTAQCEHTKDVFYFLGVMSPTGVEPEVLQAIPAGHDHAMAVITPRGSTAWDIHVIKNEHAGLLLDIFDPESIDEKFERVRSSIENHPVMRRRNAYFPLKEAVKELKLSERMVLRVFERMAEKHDFLEFREIDGKPVLVNRQK